MKIGDNTVSRAHAFIRYAEGEFYLEDNGSKFGTLVRVQESVKLAASLPYCVQAGRTVLTLLVRAPASKLETMARLQRPAQGKGQAEDETGRNTMVTRYAESAFHEGAIDSALDMAHPMTNVSNNLFIHHQD